MAIIRDATPQDAERLVEIYSHYVENTVISFEYVTPTVEEFEGRIRRTLEKYPYLVAVEAGEIMGYAYAGAFVGRAAYRRCCELTIYLDKNAKKRGLGRLLYEAIEERLKALGYLNMYACIGRTEVEDEYLNNNSAEFHAHMGFKQVGYFDKCGYKFGRWYDMLWMEKIIGEHK